MVVTEPELRQRMKDFHEAQLESENRLQDLSRELLEVLRELDRPENELLRTLRATITDLITAREKLAETEAREETLTNKIQQLRDELTAVKESTRRVPLPLPVGCAVRSRFGLVGEVVSCTEDLVSGVSYYAVAYADGHVGEIAGEYLTRVPLTFGLDCPEPPEFVTRVREKDGNQDECDLVRVGSDWTWASFGESASSDGIGWDLAQADRETQTLVEVLP